MAVAATDREEWETPGEHGGGESSPFMLDKSKLVVKTEGGEIRVVRGRQWMDHTAPMHIGFINMEPNTLLIPQYIDANLILFLRLGDAKIGWIHGEDLVERRLKPGDVLLIPAGSTFFLVNVGKGQRVQIICSIYTVEPTLSEDIPYQTFFIGGGEYPRSAFAGFHVSTLAAALNATEEEVGLLTEAHAAGPIIFVTGMEGEQTRRLAESMRKALKLNKRSYEGDPEIRKKGWRWTGILSSFFFGNGGWRLEEENKESRSEGDAVKPPDAYNLYDRKPDFRNKYGWSIELNEHDYAPLKKSNVAVFLVNLTADAGIDGGAAREHEGGRVRGGDVGRGKVEVVYPNGTAAMRANVKEGDVFWVPRFFPFCQVAARGGPMELFGFTTSSRRNRPQFLVGANSILRAMMGPELAAGFGLPEDELKRVTMAQNESVILPSWT
ncbi:hypothetical protein HPP92_014258 [Vanilla planifolia]|uniref:Cupin type-1 domain-containing protein n=1 Tax=Vanilla planifolia TaxID=51239 RepID=A0A835R0Y9_VANPL|nr:hypothetical protein HPP92_014258 [Vanilla planifolia]